MQKPVHRDLYDRGVVVVIDPQVGSALFHGIGIHLCPFWAKGFSVSPRVAGGASRQLLGESREGTACVDY